MKTKIIPVVLALIAGFITCIVSFIHGLGMAAFIKVFCLVLFVFFVLGMIWKVILDKNFPPEDLTEEQEAQETGEQEPEEKTDQESLEVSDAEEDEEW